jgi:hypothetical protein
MTDDARPWPSARSREPGRGVSCWAAMGRAGRSTTLDYADAGFGCWLSKRRLRLVQIRRSWLRPIRATSGPTSLVMPCGSSSHDHRIRVRGDRIERQATGEIHGGHVGHRGEPPGSLVAGELDDHLDGSAHADGHRAEPGTDSDGSRRDLLDRAHRGLQRGSLRSSATKSKTSSTGVSMTIAPSTRVMSTPPPCRGDEADGGGP